MAVDNMNVESKTAFRIHSMPALPLAALQANGEVRVLTTGDTGLYLCTATDTWSKLATILRANGATGALAGASFTFAGLIPAGCLVLAVTGRVTVAITGATGFHVGDGVDVDRWGFSIQIPAGTLITLQDITINFPVYYQAGADLVLTAVGGNFTGGQVSLIVHYLQFGTP